MLITELFKNIILIKKIINFFIIEKLLLLKARIYKINIL